MTEPETVSDVSRTTAQLHRQAIVGCGMFPLRCNSARTAVVFVGLEALSSSG
jgi:hypothetical protein